MNPIRVVAPLAVIAGCGLCYLTVSTQSSQAQPPDRQQDDLTAKVERLERQVMALQLKVNALERSRVLTVPAVPGPFAAPLRPAQPGETLPPGATPFDFNGQTFYVMPVEKTAPEKVLVEPKIIRRTEK